MIERKNPTQASMENRTPYPISFIWGGSTGGENGVRFSKMADKSIVAGMFFVEKDTKHCERYEKNCNVPKSVCDLTGKVYGGQQYHHDLQQSLDEFSEWHEIIDEKGEEFVQVKAKRPEVLVSGHNTAGHIFQIIYATLKLKKRLHPKYCIDYIIKPRESDELAYEIFEEYLEFEKQYKIFDTHIIAENELATDKMSETAKIIDYSNLSGLLGIIENTLEADAHNKFKIFCRTPYYYLTSENFIQPYYPTKIPFFDKRNYGTDVQLMLDSIKEMNSVAGSHTTILADIYPEQYEFLAKQTGKSYLHKILGRPSYHGRYFVASMKPIDIKTGDMGREFREFAEILKKMNLL